MPKSIQLPVTPSEPLDLLVVAVHPDDAEISVGGTILASIAKGMRVGVIDLTNGEPTPHGSVEVRAAETDAATQALSLDWRGNLGLPNRSLQADLKSREALASVFRLTQPKIILAPYWEDVHPDHVAASQLVDDARFWAKLSKTEMPGERYYPPKLYYYWSVHLRIHPAASFVMDISEHIEQKMKAINCYQSQIVSGRSDQFPTFLDDIRDRARYWGWTIQVPYAEPFASREEIGITKFDDLI